MSSGGYVHTLEYETCVITLESLAFPGVLTRYQFKTFGNRLLPGEKVSIALCKNKCIKTIKNVTANKLSV